MIKKFYKDMLLIRKFEEKVQQMFKDRELTGTTHFCIGQEFTPVFLSRIIEKDDIICCTHRNHGYYLSHTGDIIGLMDELKNKETGVCGGRGGSQHIINNKTFYSNGIVGGMLPIAVGMAYTEKKKESGKVVIAVLGDGTLGQGVFYESLGLASRWRVPVVFLLEDNNYAMSTKKQLDRLDIENICEGFHIEFNSISSYNKLKYLKEYILNFKKEYVGWTRQTNRPSFLYIPTNRLCGHSKSDDCKYISKTEIEFAKEDDPINILREEIDKSGKVEKQIIKKIEKKT